MSWEEETLNPTRPPIFNQINHSFLPPLNMNKNNKFYLNQFYNQIFFPSPIYLKC